MPLNRTPPPSLPEKKDPKNPQSKNDDKQKQSKSNSISTHVSKKSLELCLKQIQEEKALEAEFMEKRLEQEKILEEKFIKKKYEILQQIVENESVGDVDDENVSEKKQERLNEWLMKQPNNINSNLRKDQVFNHQKHVNSKPLDFDKIYEETFQATLTSQQLAARQILSKDLPNFYGKYSEWPSFISCFESSTQICGITEDENLIRLRKCLKGDALEAVKNRLFLPNQVKNVIETLRRLYGRPELIINSLLGKIRNDPPPKVDKLSTIIKFALDVDNICATMQATECGLHLQNPLLLQELVEKLPPSLRLKWGLEKQFNQSDLIEFSSWLNKIGDAANEVTYHLESKAEQKNKIEKTFINTHESLDKKCFACGRSCVCLESCPTFLNRNVAGRWSLIKENRLCRICLKKHRSKCLKNNVCNVDGCKFKHHNLLHRRKEENENNEIDVSKQSKTSDNSAVSAIFHARSPNNQILFRILPVTIYNKEKVVNTYAFLDDGSSATLMEQRIADELGIKGENVPLTLKWTANTERSEPDSQKINIKISGQDQKTFELNGVHTVKSLSLPKQSVNIENLSNKYKHLKHVPIKSYDNAVPKILIGLKHSKLTIPLRIKEGRFNDPFAMKTRLGWLACGPCDGHSLSANYQMHICECSTDHDGRLDEHLKEYFSIESLGTKRISCKSKDEEKAEQLLQEKTRRIGNRFEIPLLWKNSIIKLPDNLEYTRQRLQSLEKRLKKEPNLHKAMNELIKEYIKKGYATLLKEKARTGKTWYLPIFPVLNPNKPGKLRIVWDAAATLQGVSLNSMLLTGPDIISPLLGILIRFREKKVALCGDIREMFHQIRIVKEDTDAQRFLWRNSETNMIETYVLNVMSFGATSSPYCAQFIKNKNAQEFQEKYPQAAIEIVMNHYVDDFISSFDSEEETITVAKQVIYIHSQGGFHIRNFRSNSLIVTRELEGDRPESTIELPTSETEKILGLWWSPQSDTFFFKINYEFQNSMKRPTKREVLRFLMRIYDPLGLVAHILINIKILMQSIWRSGITWDDEIKDDQFKIWKKWLKQFPDIENIKIPRKYLQNLQFKNADSVELHMFCDASEEAYATVAYLRVTHQKEVEISLISSKTRVAPLRSISIPRMELEAAVLGCRLAQTISKSHSIKLTKHFYWTDSKTVILWLRSQSRKHKQFVAFRIGEILEKTKVTSWRWLPSKMNVADEATKTKNNITISNESRWYTGPQFLLESEENWPTIELNNESLDEKIINEYHHSTIERKCIIEIERFSKWRKLVNTIVKVFQFIKLYVFKRKNSELDSQHFIEKAEVFLFKTAQLDAYQEEIRFLKNNPESTLPKSSKIYSISPYLDDKGLLRISGRIDAANCVDDYTKRPIILPKEHYITHLVVSYFHCLYKHIFAETVVNEIRQRFYISNLRTMVKKIQRTCQVCSNRRSRPSVPEMAPLPAARLQAFTRPFSYIGMDYFGPMLVTVGRRSEKRWGVLITCLTIRAIHVEIAHTLTSDSCILALKRFAARRGMPLQIYTDNGTNFRGASQELQAMVASIDCDVLKEKFGEGKLKWSFIPPAAPHMGGAWERLVRSVKQTLAQMDSIRSPNDEKLLTMMAEVENIINSRPLTYVPINGEEDEALTPNHFLLGSSNGLKPMGELNDEGKILKKNWLAVERFTNWFWKRWVREFLPDLTRRTKWFAQSRAIAVGDVVIIIDENSPRNLWPMGRVLEVHPSRDGKIRKATIKTKDTIYVRPVSKLAILDVSSEPKEGKQDQSSNLPGGTVDAAGNAGKNF